jgi:hypothetical protein
MDKLLKSYFKKVVFKKSSPQKSTFSIDTIFPPEFYKWEKMKGDFVIRKNGIGSKIEGRFFLKYPNTLLHKNDSLEYFYLQDNFGDSNIYLNAFKYIFYNPQKINKKFCNCYEKKNYFSTQYVNDSRLNDDFFDLKNFKLNYKGNFECYITGIGTVPLNMSGGNYKIKIYYLVIP